MENTERQIVLVRLLKQNPNNVKAKEELIECLYKFVYGIALKITKNRELIKDLIQEAYISIFADAVRKYDETKEANFLSYSSFWIMNAMKTYILDNMTIIRFPRNVASVYYRKQHCSKEDFSVQKEHVRKALEYSFMSTNANVYDDVTIEDVLPSNDILEDEDDSHPELKKAIAQVHLTPREKDIFTNVVSNEEDDVITMRQESMRLGISRERVRQIRNNVLRKIRNQLKNNIGNHNG